MLRLDINRLLFTIGYIVVLIKLFIESSTIQAIPIFEAIKDNYNTPALLLLAVLTMFKINYIRSITMKNLIGLVIVFGTLSLSSYFSKSYTLIYITLLLFLALNVEFRYIAKTFFIIKFPAVVILAGLSLVGIIENFEFIDRIRGSRFALGAIYATDFAASVFYVQITYYYLRKSINIIEVVISAGLVYLITIYTDARVSILLMSVAIIVFYLVGTRFSWIIKGIFENRIMPYVFVIGFILSVVLSRMFSYTDRTMLAIDEILSGRLRLGNLAFETNDVRLFGQKLIMQGNGWRQHEWDSSIGYNFIDASYLQWLFIYGLVTTVILLVLFVLTYKKAIQVDNLPLAIILTLLAASGIIDHHVLNLANNPFIFALVPVIFNRDKGDKLWD